MAAMAWRSGASVAHFLPRVQLQLGRRRLVLVVVRFGGGDGEGWRHG